MTPNIKVCAVIPSYNHSVKLDLISSYLIKLGLSVLIIDDASAPKHAKVLRKICENSEHIKLIVHAENQGKGGAVMTGLLSAQSLGFTHALQIDADGQHDLNDIEHLLCLAQKHQASLISGQPVFDNSIPKARLWGRSLTHFWVNVETLSLQVKDTMCGFRVYPLTTTCQLLKQVNVGKRMDFDIEIMVRLFWRHVDVKFLPTKVVYPEDGQSHFRALHDNMLITWLHIRLVLGMLVRAPCLIRQKNLKNKIISQANMANGAVNDKR